jgi:hypothetical protein
MEKQLSEFMKANPEFYGEFVGWTQKDGLGISRIDDRWYQSEYYLITSEALIPLIEAKNALIESLRQQLADTTQDRIDAERYRFLRNNNFNHIYLTCNVHKSYYDTAEVTIANDVDWYEEDPAEELDKMKATNTIWCVQYYPDTPIGFYKFNGATLDNVIDRAIECNAEEAISKTK